MKTLGRQTKTFRFAGEVKQEDRNGVAVGVIEGYASTWDIDRGDDVILRGAFRKTIDRHLKNGRPVRMLWQHNGDQLIGAFPAESMREDDNGLWVKGEINLETQAGREAYALAKQGVLSDMSIGFSIPSREFVTFSDEGDCTVRRIKEVELWEVSLVGEPMNPHAQIMSVKGATQYADLPMADRSRDWDSDAAVGRVRQFASSTDEATQEYRQAFLWFDADAPENLTSYKLPIADVIDGRLVAVPRAVFSAAAAMLGARGGVDLPDGDRAAVIAHIERYYERIGAPSPFRTEAGLDLSLVEQAVTMRDVETLLKWMGISCKAAKLLISRVKGTKDCDDQSGSGGVDDDGTKKALEQKLKDFNNQHTANVISNRLRNMS